MSSLSFASAAGGYRLDELGWLQFERVCSLLLSADDVGFEDLRWAGHADTERVVVVDRPVILRASESRLEGPVTVVVLWVAEDRSPERRLSSLVQRLDGVGSWCGERMLLLTNLDGAAVRPAVQRSAWSADRTVVVLGKRELSAGLDRHPDVRLAMPAVLGSRDLTPLLSAATRARSSLDVERAQGLARVFWPTRAYEQVTGPRARVPRRSRCAPHD